jgi:hypothetical protein
LTITLVIHESWSTAVPHALARILAGLAALEQPRALGDDADDLSTLLDGLLDDAPESSPAPAAAPQPAPSKPPAAATPPATQDWDGTPRTGRSLYRWACDRKALPDVNRVGKSFGYPKRITDWEPGQVAAAYAVLSAEPAPNGRAR